MNDDRRAGAGSPDPAAMPGAGRTAQNLLIARDLLLDLPDVPAVYVVQGRRPTYQELVPLRSDARGLRVTVDGDGFVAIRRPGAAVTEPIDAAERGGIAALAGRAGAALDAWGGRHTLFPGLAEGTR